MATWSIQICLDPTGQSVFEHEVVADSAEHTKTGTTVLQDAKGNIVAVAPSNAVVTRTS